MRSNDRARVLLVRATAFVQGLALVVIPAASSTLTSPRGLGLSEARYGTLFVPQTILAVACSLAGAALGRRLGTQATLRIGFAANVVAMLLIAATALVFAGHGAAFYTLLCATSCLGIGFSVVTPRLNVLAARLEPAHADRAGLIVNALLGGSAAIAPLLYIVFVSAGTWWALPLLCALAMTALAIATARISFQDAIESPDERSSLPGRIWGFAAFAFAYGVCEQIDGSWAPLYVTHRLGAAPSYGSLALAFFWAIATTARTVFALASAKARPALVFRSLPIVLAASFALLAILPADTPGPEAVATFALAGLGISALLPLVLSFGERSMPKIATSATSVIFASYLVGYGIAAFGVGPLQERGITFPAIDFTGGAIALILATLATTITRRTGEAA